MVSASGLNPNLMVTGGPTLAGAGRWPADPASHLASHPWLPRPGAPSMWLSGSPYGTHLFFFPSMAVVLELCHVTTSICHAFILILVNNK